MDRGPGTLVGDLSRPENWPESPGAIRFVETHASLVFVGEELVHKVKKRKNYGFFDYSTLENRKRFCEEEVRLNRRLAPGVYLGVVPVTRDASGHSFHRPGEVVDYAVSMKRLPDEWSALAKLRAGKLAAADLARIAATLAAFYREARCVPEFGRIEVVRENVQENFRQAEPFVGRFLSPSAFEETRSFQEGFLEAERARFERRVASGRIRDGHGDLRLEHVYLTPEGPKAIDCIEFLDRFRLGDIASDVAFLGMDLVHSGRGDLAEAFIARFAYEADDFGIYPLLDFYMSYRAWVRGKVTAFLATDAEAAEETRTRKAAEAPRFFARARALAFPDRPRPRLVAVGGVVGSGKTTLSWALSEKMGAAVVVADATRKFLAGIPRDRPGPESIYTTEFSRRVQDEMFERAEAVLVSGRSVVLDTTFAARALRQRAREFAREWGAEFVFVECRCPDEVCRERLRARRGDVSDAGEELLERFRKAFEPATELEPGESRVADTTRPVEEVVASLGL